MDLRQPAYKKKLERTRLRDIFVASDVRVDHVQKEALYCMFGRLQSSKAAEGGGGRCQRTNVNQENCYSHTIGRTRSGQRRHSHDISVAVNPTLRLGFTAT